MENKEKDIGLFLMPKPECAPYLSELEDTIIESKFKIEEVYLVRNWEHTSRLIYQHQLENSDDNFRFAFENHVILLKYMYGNRSCILVVDQADNEESDIKDKCEDVYRIKGKFRNKLSKTLDGTFFLAADTNRLSEGRFLGGNEGIIGVYNKGFTPIRNDFKGLWDYFYFKYIH